MEAPKKDTNPLANPFKSFDAKQIIDQLKNHEVVNHLYENNCLYNIAFLSSESQDQLARKIRAYTLSAFLTSPKLSDFDEENKKVKCGLQNRVRQKRLKKSNLLALSKTWDLLRKQATPAWVNVANNLGNLIGQTKLIDKYLTPEQQTELTTIENNFRSYVEFLPFSPKALIFAWNKLLDIEKQINTAIKNYSKPWPHENQLKHDFFKEYKNFLDDFKNEIANQKNKIWTASLKILEQLRANKILHQVDPVIHLNKAFADSKADIKLPALAESVEAHEIDQLFELIAQQEVIESQAWGSFLSFPFPANSLLQFHMCIGPCFKKIRHANNEEVTEIGVVCYPKDQANDFAGHVHKNLEWSKYRGIDPSALWRFNLAVCHINLDHNNQLDQYTSGLEILIEEITKHQKVDARGLKGKEAELYAACKGALVVKGLSLLTFFEKDWKAFLEAVSVKQSNQTKPIVVVGKFIRLIQDYPEIEDRNRLLLDKIKKEIRVLEQVCFVNYLENTRNRKEQDQNHWQDMLSACRNEQTDNLLISFLQDKAKVDIVEVAAHLQHEGNMSLQQAQETIRHHIDTRLLEISGPDHFLYEAMVKCDTWFGASLTPLQTMWRDLRTKNMNEKTEEVLGNTQDKWPLFEKDEFALLSADARRNFIVKLREKTFDNENYHVSSPLKWENLLYALGDSDFTLEYLKKLTGQQFLGLLSAEYPLRTKLIKSSPRFIQHLNNLIMAFFTEAVAKKRPGHREILQNYVRVFFDSNKAMYEQMDDICFTHIKDMTQRCHPERNILVYLMDGYNYPNSDKGSNTLFEWLKKFPIFPWNPAIWTLIKKVGASKGDRFKALEQHWRAEWLREGLNKNQAETVTQILPDLLVKLPKGPECFEFLFGEKSKQILIDLNNVDGLDYAAFNLWLVRDCNFQFLWNHCCLELRASTHILAGEIRAIERKRGSDRIYRIEDKKPPLQLAKELSKALHGEAKDLRELYQQHLCDFIIAGMTNPEQFPIDLIYDGLAMIFLEGQEDFEWLRDFLKKALFESFGRKYEVHKNRYLALIKEPWESAWHLLPKEVSKHKWIFKIGVLLDRKNIDHLVFMKKAIENETLVSNLFEAQDWLLASEVKKNVALPYFGPTSWSLTIPLLPSSLRSKLANQLNSCHLPSLTPNSWSALYLAQKILESGNYNSEEAKTLEHYRGIAQNAAHRFASDPDAPAIIAEYQRSLLWNRWKRVLEKIGVWKSPEKGSNATSWFYGSCHIDPSQIKFLLSKHANHEYWTEVEDIQVATQFQAIAGISFDNLFQHIFCGYDVVPYDLIQLKKENTCLLIKPKVDGTTTFAEVEKQDEWTIDQKSFGARFVQELIFESRDDHPSHYRLIPVGINTYALDRMHAEFVDTTERQPEVPKPFAPDYSDWTGGKEPGETHVNYLPQNLSFIFACSNEMQKPLDAKLVKRFTDINFKDCFNSFLLGWHSFTNRLTNLFEEPSDVNMRKEWSTKFSGQFFSQEKIEEALNRLEFLQKLLKYDPTMSLQEILGAFDPVKANFYTFSQPHKPIQSYKLIKEKPGLLLTPAFALKELYLANEKYGSPCLLYKSGSPKETSLKHVLSFLNWLEHHQKALNDLAQRFVSHAPYTEELKVIQKLWELKPAQLAHFYKNFVEQYNNMNPRKIGLVNDYLPVKNWEKVHVLYRKQQPFLEPWLVALFPNVQELNLINSLITEEDLVTISERAPLLRTLNLSDSKIKKSPKKIFEDLLTPHRMFRGFRAFSKGCHIDAKQIYFPNLYLFIAQRIDHCVEEDRRSKLLNLVIISPKLCYVNFKDALALTGLSIGTKNSALECHLEGTQLSFSRPKVRRDAEWLNQEYYPGNSIEMAKKSIALDALRLFEKLIVDVSLRNHCDELIVHAVQCNALKCLTYLFDTLKAGEKEDLIGRSQLLNHAYQHKHLEIFEYLCQYSSVTSCPLNEFGQSLLHEAIIRGDWDYVRPLSKVQAFLLLKDDYGVTPLHLLLKANAHEMYDISMSALNPLDDKGNNPLHYAAIEGSTKMAIDWIANIPIDDRDYIINQYNKLEVTPLHLAAYYGHVELVQSLISAGADPFAKSRSGTYCLDWAAEKGHDSVIRYLLNSPVGQALYSESNALEIAEQNDRQSTVYLLKEYGRKWFFPSLNPLFQTTQLRPTVFFGANRKKGYLIQPIAPGVGSGLNAMLGITEDDDPVLRWRGRPENIKNRFIEKWRPDLRIPLYREFFKMVHDYYNQMRTGQRVQNDWPFEELKSLFNDISSIRRQQDVVVSEIRKYCLQNSKNYKEAFVAFERDFPGELVGGKITTIYIHNLLRWIEIMSRRPDPMSQVTWRSIYRRLSLLEEQVNSIINSASKLMEKCKDLYLEQIVHPKYQWEPADLMFLSDVFEIPAIVVTPGDTDKDLPDDVRIILRNNDGTYCRLEPEPEAY